jgi:hypothetical protein
LKEKGAHLIDFDEIARDVVIPGKPAYNGSFWFCLSVCLELFFLFV